MEARSFCCHTGHKVWQAVWDSLDKNHDGTVSADEFKVLDENKDGSVRPRVMKFMSKELGFDIVDEEEALRAMYFAQVVILTRTGSSHGMSSGKRI